MSNTPDFNQFGKELWDVANILRDDAVHATDRLEIFSLFLFLKFQDEIALLEEENLKKQPSENEQLIPDRYRFHKWANDPDGYAKSLGFPDSIQFCKQMFIDLAEREKHSTHPSAHDVTRLFKETVFPLRYAPTVRKLGSKLKNLNLLDVMSRKNRARRTV